MAFVYLAREVMSASQEFSKFRLGELDPSNAQISTLEIWLVMSRWLPAVGAAVSSVSAPGLCNARHAWHCPRNSSSPSACRSTRPASLSLLHSFLVFCGAFPATLTLRVSAWFLSPAKCLLPISTENPALTASTLPSHRFDSLISISFISKFSCLLNTLVILLSFQPQLSKKKKKKVF